MSKSLLLIAALYFGLTLSYLFAVPVGEAPDEPAHFLYAQQMADTGAPPAKPPPQRDSFWKNGFVTSNYEWHQPPLYYALSAVVLRVGRLLALSPRYAAFPAINPDFPGLQRPLFVPVPLVFSEVHLARLLSTLLGLGSVYATFALARRFLPGERWLPELAAGFVAFIPQFTFLHAYVTNDTLAIFGSAWGLLALVAVARADPSQQRRGWLLAGCAVALALAAKMTTWFLIPLGLLLAALHLLTRRRNLTDSLVDLLIFGAASLCGLLLSRLLWPDLIQRLLSSPQSRGINPDFVTLQHIRTIFPMAHTSFWGMFGWVNMPLAPQLLSLLDGVLLIGLVGAIFWLLRRGRGLLPGQRTAIALLISASGAVLVAFWYFNLTIVQPQGRLLFPALPAIGLGVALGWLHWAGRYQGAATFLILALLFAVNVTSLITVIFPAFGLLAG
ncbi:MAG: phospholipid carrier-dependent glycosyltransferase [Chloroflexi bacterium]|nr:MAG: phospholipid carrier-dependent glycosyltransferase [Chloroflexota bacterium]